MEEKWASVTLFTVFTKTISQNYNIAVDLVRTWRNKILSIKLLNILQCLPVHLLLKGGVIRQVCHPLPFFILVYHIMGAIDTWRDKPCLWHITPCITTYKVWVLTINSANVWWWHQKWSTPCWNSCSRLSGQKFHPSSESSCSWWKLWEKYLASRQVERALLSSSPVLPKVLALLTSPHGPPLKPKKGLAPSGSSIPSSSSSHSGGRTLGWVG